MDRSSVLMLLASPNYLQVTSSSGAAGSPGVQVAAINAQLDKTWAPEASRSANSCVHHAHACAA